MKFILSLISFVFIFSFSYAQEDVNDIALKSKKYVSIRTQSYLTYQKRLERQQAKLLKRLSNKEKKLARNLAKKDSTAYQNYIAQSVTYDSLLKLSKCDSCLAIQSAKAKKNKVLDSLQKIASINGITSTEDSSRLFQLTQRANNSQYINDKIAARSTYIKSLSKNTNCKIPGFIGLEKEVYYSKEKIKVFKEIENQPTKVEEDALDYLKGTDAYSKVISPAMQLPNNSSAYNGISDQGQLDQLGYQTRQAMQKSIKDKFGEKLGDLSGTLNNQVKDWQETKTKIQAFANSTKSVKEIKRPDALSFKVNPMRGLPFCKRIDKQVSWQIQKQGIVPLTLLTLSADVVFKHTPRLSYGVGIINSIGLGTGWRDIHLTYQGVGYKVFSTWSWMYNISAYAGYERTFGRAMFTKNENIDNSISNTMHSNKYYSESILIGIAKQYKISDKYKGSVQFLYDVWWQDKGMSSPFLIRFTNAKQ